MSKSTTPPSSPVTRAKLPGVDRLDLMQNFVRIVEAGSLSAAATQLRSTQPTVSRRLQALEKLLGLRLLQRSTHAMKLTEDGERCYVHAKTLLDSWAAVEADLRGAQDVPRGHLRVLAPHAFGQDLLVGPLASFLSRHPGVNVDWLLQDRLADFIAEGIDCAIRVGTVDDPTLVAVRLAEVPRILVAAPGLWGRGPAPRTPAALATLPWVALRQFYVNELQLQRVGGTRRETLHISPRVSTDSLYAARSAACEGVGAAALSAWLVADDIASGRLRRLAPDWEAAPLPVQLVFPYARLYPARLRAFVDWMKREMPALVASKAPAADARH